MKYRVNFGDGSVTPQTFKSQRDAERWIASAQKQGSDPYSHRYFVEFWDSIAGWIPVERPSRQVHHATKRATAISKGAKKANEEIYDLLHNKYFQSIPNDELFAIVRRAGFRFDPLEEEFILTGREGKATWQLHDETGREVNHMLVLTWHKMDRTGRYEVVAYVS